jgi:hypothetical protein
MKTIISIIIALSLFLGINKNAYTQEQDIIGVFSSNELLDEPYNLWYEAEYQYSPDEQVINDIINLQSDFKITIVLGTWCSDSQTQVPRFLKILDEINYNTDGFLLIGVDRQKKVDNFDIEKYNIEKVPTFIIYRENVEIGRIIETPTKTLEEDLFDILSK